MLLWCHCEQQEPTRHNLLQGGLGGTLGELLNDVGCVVWREASLGVGRYVFH